MHAPSLQLCPVLCDPVACFCLWDSPGKNTGVGCLFLLQGIFPTQGSNLHLLCLPHWRVGSLPLASPGKPMTMMISTLTPHWVCRDCILSFYKLHFHDDKTCHCLVISICIAGTATHPQAPPRISGGWVTHSSLWVCSGWFCCSLIPSSHRWPSFYLASKVVARDGFPVKLMKQFCLRRDPLKILEIS